MHTSAIVRKLLSRLYPEYWIFQNWQILMQFFKLKWWWPEIYLTRCQVCKNIYHRPFKILLLLIFLTFYLFLEACIFIVISVGFNARQTPVFDPWPISSPFLQIKQEGKLLLFKRGNGWHLCYFLNILRSVLSRIASTLSLELIFSITFTFSR